MPSRVGCSHFPMMGTRLPLICLRMLADPFKAMSCQSDPRSFQGLGRTGLPLLLLGPKCLPTSAEISVGNTGLRRSQRFKQGKGSQAGTDSGSP